MYLLSTSIEIAAPPATVRDKFLDFSSIPEYTPNGFVRSIAPAASDKSPRDLKPGDQLKCSIGYGKMQISPTLHENTSSTFSWRGSLLGVFAGVHMFHFEEIPGLGEGQKSRTRFVHEEKFTGVLSFLIGENFVAKWVGANEDTRKGFNGFNQDFKVWVERAESRK
ncbi:hypothetical protein V1525DRAFT_392000 [Lipomyces kononenkoae]|uniref:Uncharacterized protein n=1 Tax=Lipomyces kononenkoae TaxID=34357 RepID=A0ACC3SQF5_LIPKO